MIISNSLKNARNTVSIVSQLQIHWMNIYNTNNHIVNFDILLLLRKITSYYDWIMFKYRLLVQKIY